MSVGEGVGVGGGGVLEVGGEEVDGGLDVVFVDHFVDGVDVAGGDAEGDAGASGGGALEGAAVGAAAGEDFELVGDGVAGGEVAEMFDEEGVADHGPVHEFDADAGAEGGDLGVGAAAGVIGGDGGVEGDADVGLDAEGGGGGAAEADFLLGGGDGDDGAGGGAEFAEGFDHDEDADAVVEAFGGDGVAAFGEVAVEGDHAADFEGLADGVGGEAGVDEELFDFGLFFVGFGEEVRRFGGVAEDAGEDIAVLGGDADALGEELAGVEAAEGLNAEEAFVVDVFDDEADFVHVGGDHDAGFAGAGEGGVEVAHGVGFEGGGVEGGEFAADDAADEGFLAGDAAGFAEFFEEGEVHEVARCWTRWAKARRRASPSAWLFSGWNWTAWHSPKETALT